MLMIGRTTPGADPQDPNQLLTFEHVQRKTTFSENKIRDLIEKGEFPRYRNIRNLSLFLQKEIYAWILEQFSLSKNFVHILSPVFFEEIFQLPIPRMRNSA